MKKILLIMPYSSGHGGMETVFTTLFNSYLAEKYEFTFLLLDIADEQWLSQIPNHVRVIKRPKSTSGGGEIAA